MISAGGFAFVPVQAIGKDRQIRLRGLAGVHHLRRVDVAVVDWRGWWGDFMHYKEC